GIFDKRVGQMWNDNSASIVVPANGSVSVTNPIGYSVTYANTTSKSSTVKITANQVIPIAPFNVTNFYFNFALKSGGHFDGTKLRFTANNLFNAHNIVGDSQ